jgi:hypothetical protein
MLRRLGRGLNDGVHGPLPCPWLIVSRSIGGFGGFFDFSGGSNRFVRRQWPDCGLHLHGYSAH